MGRPGGVVIAGKALRSLEEPRSGSGFARLTSLRHFPRDGVDDRRLGSRCVPALAVERKNQRNPIRLVAGQIRQYVADYVFGSVER